MKRLLLVFVVACLSLPPVPAHAQAAERARDELVQTQRTAMTTLLGAGTLSMAAGGTLLASREGPFTDAFAIQQLAWGGVNAAIAGVALWGLSREAARAESLTYWQDRRRTVRRIFWINAALDVLYVTSGALLWGLSRDRSWQGTGAGIVPQGAFLLGFDASAALAL